VYFQYKYEHVRAVWINETFDWSRMLKTSAFFYVLLPTSNISIHTQPLYREVKAKGSRSYWIKKQIDPFCVHPSISSTPLQAFRFWLFDGFPFYDLCSSFTTVCDLLLYFTGCTCTLL